MSASEQISNKCDQILLEKLVAILPKLLEPNSDTIDQATLEFKNVANHPAFLPTLTQIMISNSSNLQLYTKQLAAVLFRRQILKNWEKFDGDMKNLVRQASLEYLGQVEDSVSYKSLAEIVAGIAKFELASDQSWPELMQVISASTNIKNSYADRLKGTELLKCVTTAASAALQSDTLLPVILNLFHELLLAEDVTAGNTVLSQSVHKNVLDSIIPVLDYMEDKFLSQAQIFLPRLVNVIDQLVAWDEIIGSEVLGMFTELCEIDCSDYVSIEVAKDMIGIALKIAGNCELEEDTRSIALMQIQMLIKYKKKALIRFDLVEVLCSELQKLVIAEDPDDGIMSGVDGDRTVYGHGFKN